MSGRVTRYDLLAVFETTKRAALAAGISEAARWQLDTGSKTYGNAYRLWLRHEDPTCTGHYSPAVRDYLGMTASEAARTLATLRDAFDAVTWTAVKAAQ